MTPVGTLAEVRTAISVMRHLGRCDETSITDALTTLRFAAGDQGADIERVALILGRYAAVRTRACGIDVEFWASVALPAAADWEHEPDRQAEEGAA